MRTNIRKKDPEGNLYLSTSIMKLIEPDSSEDNSDDDNATYHPRKRRRGAK
jgi:hypothetical protein